MKVFQNYLTCEGFLKYWLVGDILRFLIRL